MTVMPTRTIYGRTRNTVPYMSKHLFLGIGLRVMAERGRDTYYLI